MKLDAEFIRMPLRFDPDRLAEEANQFAESDWRKHPQGHAGNTALPFVAAHGDPDDDSVRGPMRPTPFLERCPYIKQVLASLGTPIGRTRFMRIQGHGEATRHVDTNYYWSQRVRVHIPVITYPGVRFLCGDKEVFMPAGECWLFDTWRMHNVLNPDDRPRIHLVCDTVGSAEFWEMVDDAERPFADAPDAPTASRVVPYMAGKDVDIDYETHNFPVVITPWEQECQLASILEDLNCDDSEQVADLERTLRQFHRKWKGLWACYGESRRGEGEYKSALAELQSALSPFKEISLVNGVSAAETVLQWVVRPALNYDLGMLPPETPIPREKRIVSEPAKPAAIAKSSVRSHLAASAPSAAPSAAKTTAEHSFDRPVIIVAAPRSGSTMLFELLAGSPGFVTIGGESHEVFESIPGLRPGDGNWVSNRLGLGDVTPERIEAVKAGFLSRLRDRNGKLPAPGPVRLLEKTPKNALRVPFLLSVFPDALFVYLHRDPRENISSIIEAWKSGKFVTYPKLPGWSGPPWSLLLVPGWRELAGKKLGEIAATQWKEAHDQILTDLSKLPADRWCPVSYADVLADPQKEAERICRFAGVPWDKAIDGDLPLSRHTLTPPAPDKWKKNAGEIEPVLPMIADANTRVMTAFRRHSEAAAGSSEIIPPPAAAHDPTAFRSVHTSTLPELLGQLGISLLVSTYQAGKLFVVRNDAKKLNTHFRTFESPMGMAVDRGRLALGTKNQVWEFINQPDVGKKLDPVGKHDGCFLPRTTNYTGDIRIHEIAYANSELWAVNTRFSCLCTFDPDHSFIPRWRPPFVTHLAPEDRCHLNGLAVVDGKVKYVTALGTANTAGGWRDTKKDGGVLMEVPTGEILVRGLSMPHSPRLYQGKLWILESGAGTLSTADLKTGKTTVVAELPGFTRGLDFCGPFAFVGLSQVRETAVFSGIPITERVQERKCGVWAVDLRSGQVVGFLEFSGAVQEIFAVQVLAGMRFPDVIHDDAEVLANSFILPDEALAEVATLS